METGKFLECALLAGACALPLVAVGAVVTRDDGDELVACDGCGEMCPPEALAEGPFGSRWCARCDAPRAPAPTPAAFDCIIEDDGEP